MRRTKAVIAIFISGATDVGTRGRCRTNIGIFLWTPVVPRIEHLGRELVAAAYVDRMGRRSAMVGSNLLVSLLVFCIALKFAFDWPTAVGALSLCAVMLFFSLGPGPLTFVVVNEMLPLALRARVVAVAVFFNRLGSGTIALTFLSLKDAIGVVAAFSLYALLGLLITHACVEPYGKQSLLGCGAAAEPPPVLG